MLASPRVHRVQVPTTLCPLLPQDFVLGLSILLRGTVHEKLNWAFNLYDINKDGYITKEVPASKQGLRADTPVLLAHLLLLCHAQGCSVAGGTEVGQGGGLSVPRGQSRYGCNHGIHLSGAAFIPVSSICGGGCSGVRSVGKRILTLPPLYRTGLAWLPTLTPGACY